MRDLNRLNYLVQNRVWWLCHREEYSAIFEKRMMGQELRAAYHTSQVSDWEEVIELWQLLESEESPEE